MSKWSTESRRGAPNDPTTANGAAEGVAETFMERPDTGMNGPLDPLDRRFGGHDPAVIGEKVVFRLWADGVVSGRAIEQARSEGDQRLRLDQRLVRLHLIDEEAAAHALAEELNAPEAEDADFPDAPVMADLLPRRFVEEALALPLSDDGEVLTLAMADPIDDYAQRAIAMKTRRQLDVLIASPRRIRAEIGKLYDRTAVRKAPSLRNADTTTRRPAAHVAPENGLFGGKSLQEAPQASKPHGFDAPHAHHSIPEWDVSLDDADVDAGQGRAARARNRDWREAEEDRHGAARRAQADDVYDDLYEDEYFDDDVAPVVARPTPAVAPRQDRQELVARLATPRFVRPKRVTRKNRVTPSRPAAEQAPKELAASPTNRRFVNGFIDDFVSSDTSMGDFDQDWLADTEDSFGTDAVEARPARRPAPVHARKSRDTQVAKPVARSARRQTAPDEGARRTALAEVRRALREQAEVADHGPVSLPSRPISRAAGAAMEHRDGQSRDMAARGQSPRGTAKYQAARAMADREAQAVADSVLQHRLVAAPLADNRSAERANTETGITRNRSALGEIAPENIDPTALAAVRDAIAGGDGLILFAGPAGSAKIASLRALAKEAAGRDAEVLRLDRPADRIRLAQSTGRRIALGEIRDAESAEAAVRIAMTGGLVFAAIDASSACTAPERMISLGVPAYAMASSLRVAATQTLTEQGCLRCAQTGRSVSGESCPECGGAGADRRAALSEAMTLDDSLRALILARAPESALRHAMETPEPTRRPRRVRRNQRAVRRIANAALSGAYGFGAP